MIRKRLGRPGALLGVVGEVQEHHPHKFLPLDVLRYIALKTAVVRAYDPCLSCSTHALGVPALKIRLVDAGATILDELTTD